MGKRKKAIIYTALCILAIILLFIIVFQRLSGKPTVTFFGWGQASVVSGSMEPNIPVWAMVFFDENADYAPGDVVVYKNDADTLIVHRIVSITDGEVITKGDANQKEDPAFPEERIVGTVKGWIPLAGGLLMLLTHPAVMGIALAAAVAYLLWSKPSNNGKNSPS